MTETLRINPSDAAPIWRQIEEGVARLVASGGLARGEAIASVRDLAKELRVNPATVSKAYQRLVDAGVLVVRRGEGTFVAAAPPALDKAERSLILGDAADRLAVVAATLGASREETLDATRGALDRLAGKPPRPTRGSGGSGGSAGGKP